MRLCFVEPPCVVFVLDSVCKVMRELFSLAA